MADDTSISQQLDDVFEEFDDSPGSGRELTRSAFGAGTLMALVEREGVLYVEDEVGRSGVTRGASSHDEIVWQRCLSTPGRNQALEWLVKLDKKLTPIRGIRALRDGEWVATNDVASDGRTLLFVHGTFSNTDNLLAGISNSGQGEKFFDWAADRYDQILTYDHPTLAVSPMINAHALSRHLAASGAEFDVVTHSRGGLVTRWWLEAFDQHNQAHASSCFRRLAAGGDRPRGTAQHQGDAQPPLERQPGRRDAGVHGAVDVGCRSSLPGCDLSDNAGGHNTCGGRGGGDDSRAGGSEPSRQQPGVAQPPRIDGALGGSLFRRALELRE